MIIIIIISESFEEVPEGSDAALLARAMDMVGVSAKYLLSDWDSIWRMLRRQEGTIDEVLDSTTKRPVPLSRKKRAWVSLRQQRAAVDVLRAWVRKYNNVKETSTGARGMNEKESRDDVAGVSISDEQSDGNVQGGT